MALNDPAPTSSLSTSGNPPVNGLSQQTSITPNQITVEIVDNETPIVVLFGPPSCGKTMTLVRIARYLRGEGYTVEPDPTFRPTADPHYVKMCNTFNQLINNSQAAAGTNPISFMLVKVMRDGTPICQILEAPGEDYFDPQKSNQQFPPYVNSIIKSENRKLWAIFVEPDWNNANTRADYVKKINQLITDTKSQDKTIFVYNKIDKSGMVRRQGNVNVKGAIKQVKQLYPNIFTPFLNQNPITKLWKEYNCDFVPFQTGTYNESMGIITFTPSGTVYPKMLWKAILKQIRGGIWG